MNLPSGKLMALVAVFAAIGVITGTGAFTTVTAERTATVSVAGDGSALLQLAPTAGPNGAGGSSPMSPATGTNAEPSNSEGYAALSSGTLEISLAGFSGGTNVGSGVNKEATTDIKNVFIITNQGTQEVNISISDSDSDGTGDGDDGRVVFYTSNAGYSDGGIEPGEGGQNVTVGTGNSVVVSIYVDTKTGGSGPLSVSESINKGDLIEDIQIEADATS